MDPLWFNDGVWEWVGAQIAERQGKAKKLIKNKQLLTEWAAAQLGRQEVYARERDYACKSMGHDNHKVVWTHKKKTTAYMVNLTRRQCSCKFPQVMRLPCSHALILLDKLGRRRTPEDRLAFRKKWIGEQFWAENYILAYQNAVAVTPPMGTKDLERYARRAGDRQILRPVMPKKKKGKFIRCTCTAH